MNAKKGDNSSIIAIMVLAALALAVVAFLIFRGPARVKRVGVEYASGAQAEAYARSLTDYDFIRLSGITNQKMSDRHIWEEKARESVNATGYFVLKEIRVSGKQSVTLVIAAREPQMTLSTSGKYVTIDKDNYVLKVSDRVSANDPILVNGVALRYPTAGLITVAEDGQKLEDAREVASVIYANGYQGIFTSISVKESREVRLTTSKGVPVIINLRFDVLTSLDIAKGMLDSGVSDGLIEVAGTNGFYRPDAEETYSSKGM